MSQVLKFREQLDMTQEELAEKAGVSVRTIQRIEAGAPLKGHTLKSIANALDIPKEQFAETTKTPLKDVQFTKWLNLSSLLFPMIPFVNMVILLLILFISKKFTPINKKLVTLQILWSVSFVFLFMLVAFIKKWFSLTTQLTDMVMLFMVFFNLFMIIRNAIELHHRQRLYFNINFSII